MTRISMDIKQMPVNRGYSHILVLLCEVSNYMVALPLSSTRTQNILEAFQRGYLAYFGPPTHIICDQDPAFTSSLMEAFVTQLNIKVILVSPTNHKSLQAEHGIKSLSGLLVKHLSQVWSWHSCLPYSMLCYCHGLKIRVFYFFYISQTLQMNRISFMASLLNAVL